MADYKNFRDVRSTFLLERSKDCCCSEARVAGKHQCDNRFVIAAVLDEIPELEEDDGIAERAAGDIIARILLCYYCGFGF